MTLATKSASKKRVLVADILGDVGKRILQERRDVQLIEFPNTVSQEEFQKILVLHGEVHGVILGLTRFGLEELESVSGLQVVSRIGVGFDAVDVPTLTKARIPVMVCQDANHRAVAEHTLHFMLALVKRAYELHTLVVESRWHERYSYLPTELEGQEVLIVGLGRIGSRVAELCQVMGMKVKGYDPYVSNGHFDSLGVERKISLDEGLVGVDFVSLHCPKTLETTGIISKERFNLMKHGAFLVNTARGGVVDEDALYERLINGHIAGAALDVFISEPPPRTNRLLDLPNVLFSPHLAGVTAEAVDRMAYLAARNILDVIDKKPNIRNAINSDVFISG